MIYRLLFYILGLFILSFGVMLTIKADLGAGAWDALNVGLAETVGFTVGTWVIVVGIILIIINAFLSKQFPEFLAIVTISITGFFIDFWLEFIFKSWNPSGWTLKFLVFLLGLLTISLGISIYLQAKFALIPVDQFMMALRKRFGITLMTAKTIGELLALLLAFLFQGPVGLGTIIITLSIGPLVQFFFPKFEHFYRQISENH